MFITLWDGPYGDDGSELPVGKLNPIDRKSTRLNSSHRCISYAVFCLKKKNNTNKTKYVS